MKKGQRIICYGMGKDRIRRAVGFGTLAERFGAQSQIKGMETWTVEVDGCGAVPLYVHRSDVMRVQK